MTDKELKKVMETLAAKYPEPVTELFFNSPFQLLVATILSAQSTDKQVNRVTSRLFTRYNSPEDFARLNQGDLEEEISSIGLYHHKSKYIIETSRMLIGEFAGKVPERREDLIKLPGVGRKTANVLLACAFNQNALPVDTHVFRVANRLGLVNADKTEEIEEGLMKIIPEERWSDMHHWLIFHGRNTCKARNPDCRNCELRDYCRYFAGVDILSR